MAASMSPASAGGGEAGRRFCLRASSSWLLLGESDSTMTVEVGRHQGRQPKQEDWRSSTRAPPGSPWFVRGSS